MDAITLLKDDHRTVEELFKRFERAGDAAHAEKRELVGRIVEALSKHAAIEEQLFYPVTRETVPEVRDLALESLEEHHVVKWVLSELDGMDPAAERYDAKVTVLIETVRHHVEEEENDYFPKVRDELGATALENLGEALQNAKQSAPTHPHPRSPDTPPGNLVAGAGAAVVDKVTDTVAGVAQGSVTAIADLIEAITGAKVPRPASPPPAPDARRVAARVREDVTGAADQAAAVAGQARRVGEQTTRAVAGAVRDTADDAVDVARQTGSAAVDGAKATGRTAQRSAARTGSTAKRSAKKATSTAKKSAKKATSTAKKSAKRSGSTAKKATSSAKKSAKRSGSTAKRSAKKASSASKRSSSTARKAANTSPSTAKKAAKRSSSTAKKATKKTSTATKKAAKRSSSTAKKATKKTSTATKRATKRSSSTVKKASARGTRASGSAGRR
jgi:hemerythrin superfamily protein